MKYFDIYLKRLNRYGLDYQSRTQAKREKTFEAYLLKSVYKVDFNFEGNVYEGSFEKFRQDETESLHYLLTKRDLIIPNGTVLEIEGQKNPWMVYYLEDIAASGYNRYIMLKMTHFITWRGRDENIYNSWAYMYGQENNMLKDEIRSRSRMGTLDAENLKTSFFVMPLNKNVNKDDYFTVGEGELKEAYVVTGYDRQSTQGVMYVTIDPTYERDTSIENLTQEEIQSEDYFWLNGGV